MKLTSVAFTLAMASLVAASELLTPGEARAVRHKIQQSEAALEKRYRVYSGGRATYYSGSKLGAPFCGGSPPSDHSMAAAVPPGSPAKCGDILHVHYGNKHVAVRVVDQCASCANAHSVDLTKGAFRELAPLHVGVLQPIRYRVLENY